MRKHFLLVTLALVALAILFACVFAVVANNRSDVSTLQNAVDDVAADTVTDEEDDDDDVAMVQLVATPMVTSTSRQEMFLAQSAEGKSLLDTALLKARAESPEGCFTLADAEGKTTAIGATDVYALATMFVKAAHIAEPNVVVATMVVRQDLSHTMALDPTDVLLWYCVVNDAVYVATAVTYSEREYYVDMPRMVRVIRIRPTGESSALWQYAPIAARGDWFGPMTTAPIIYHDALYIAAADESDRGTRTWAYYRFDETEMRTLESCTAWGDPGTGEANLSCDVTSSGTE